MSDYKKILASALKAKQNKVAGEDLVEYMAPSLQEALDNQTHSLGKNTIFPEIDNFDKNLVLKRFKDVCRNYKKSHGKSSINPQMLLGESIKDLQETMELEKPHRNDLAKLAEAMIRDEYDMGPDVVEINCELVDKVLLLGAKKEPKPVSETLDFMDHEEMKSSKAEINKRRFVNAMIQGAAKKSTYMFNLVDDELADIEPLLLNKYNKLMTATDYSYFVIDKMADQISGGIVKVQFPTPENPKAVIYAQALCFPVLVHELVKGVMELIAAHGLPKDKKLGEYVIGQADYLDAEPWDMRIGPALWERFTENIPSDDFKLKHQIFYDLMSLPTADFEAKMREILAGTERGKQIILDCIDKYKSEISSEDFNEAMAEQAKEEPEAYSLKDLLGEYSDESDDKDSWDLEDLV